MIRLASHCAVCSEKPSESLVAPHLVEALGVPCICHLHTSLISKCFLHVELSFHKLYFKLFVGENDTFFIFLCINFTFKCPVHNYKCITNKRIKLECVIGQ